MKSTQTIKELGKFISGLHPDLEILAKAASNNDVNELLRQYRLHVMSLAYEKFSEPPHIIKPEILRGRIMDLRFHDQHGVVEVEKDGKTFTRLESIVLADNLPTLVELRMPTADDAVAKYFKNAKKKRQVMQDLYGHDFGWLLMMPSNFKGCRSAYLHEFKSRGGIVAILPYSSTDFQRVRNPQ